MALSQLQIIQSLGQAISWFEREFEWGVPPTEMRHLCGRIGELYAALITNGQMATEVNQRGYDVISGSGEKISVKTTATNGKTGTISFNRNTLELVDRVIVLRLNTDEMQIEVLCDLPLEKARALMSGAENAHTLTIPVGRLSQEPKITNTRAINEVCFDGAMIRELETGKIIVERDGETVSPAKPELRRFAAMLGIDILNENGNPRNTRQLGNLIIRAVSARSSIDSTR